MTEEQPKRRTWKRSLHIGRLYLTLSNCRLRKRNDLRDYPGKERPKDIKMSMYEEQEATCPICGGIFPYDMMELHHVLPWCRFTELRGNRANILLLCRSCHKEIHVNPWKMIEMMKAKAEELGIRLEDYYKID